MHDDEIFKQLKVDGKELNYLISNYGRVLGLYRGKFLHPEVTDKGYLRIPIYFNNSSEHKKFFLHRLVGMMFVDGYSPELTINHKDGNHANNYYKNLEWVTIEENNQHAIDNGFHPTGEDHPRSKYTNEQIREVCRLLEQFVTTYDICRLTGVQPSTICDVRNRKGWLHISKDYSWHKDHGNIVGAVFINTLHKNITNYFEQGLKTKSIMQKLHISLADKQSRKRIKHLRKLYEMI